MNYFETAKAITRASFPHERSGGKMEFTVFKTSGRDSNRKRTVEFTSLEQFIDWVKETKRDVIVHQDGVTLEIYDDYRE
jgi:hypothetical protein